MSSGVGRLDKGRRRRRRPWRLHKKPTPEKIKLYCERMRIGRGAQNPGINHIFGDDEITSKVKRAFILDGAPNNEYHLMDLLPFPRMEIRGLRAPTLLPFSTRPLFPIYPRKLEIDSGIEMYLGCTAGNLDSSFLLVGGRGLLKANK